MRRALFAAAALLLTASASAAPPPPLAPERASFYEAFFTALPHTFPAESTAKLEQLVDDRVQVYDAGKLIHGSRGAWLAWLQSKMGKGDKVQSVSLSREDFFFQPESRILVREFWSSYIPGVSGHPEFDNRLVSYQFAGDKLVRIDYGDWVRPMEDGLAGRLRGRRN